MTDLIAELAEVVRLSDRASPGVWRAMREGNQFIGDKPTAASRVDGPKRPWNPYALKAFGFGPTEHEKVRFTDSDADFVVALVNVFRTHHATLTRIIESEAMLSADYEALVIRLGEVTVELEKARKDAERYQTLKDAAWNDEVWHALDERDSDGLDAALDAMHDSAREASKA